MPEKNLLALLEPMTDEQWREHMAGWSRGQRWSFLTALVILGYLHRGRNFIARRLRGH